MNKALSILCLLGMLLVCPVSVAQGVRESGDKVTLKLVSGDTMTGTVGPIRDGTVSLITDYGVVRVPIAKLSAESRKQLGITDVTNVESLRRRVVELEALVATLREENAALRKAALQTPGVVPQPVASGAGSPAAKSQPTPPASGLSYRISTTGKRHNSHCRYYNSKGRACGPTEGVACKICGG